MEGEAFGGCVDLEREVGVGVEIDVVGGCCCHVGSNSVGSEVGTVFVMNSRTHEEMDQSIWIGARDSGKGGLCDSDRLI